MEKATLIPQYLAAGYSCFWIQTDEPRRAASSLRRIIEGYKRKDGTSYTVANWDCAADPNPLKPIVGLEQAPNLSIVFATNYHWFIDKPPIIQKIQNEVEVWKHQRKAFVVISPTMKIPAELEKDFLPMEFALPDDADIKDAVNFISQSAKKEAPTGELLEKVVKASRGLAQVELENVLARSYVVKGEPDPKFIHKHKAAMVEKNGLLEVVEPTVSFDDICGYDQIKKFALATISNESAKGMLILGPPGCGKTLFMNCLAGATGKFTVSLNFGKLMSKFQGESDRNLEEVIKIIEAIGDCIVQVDEFEKQFAGAGSSGDMDSGTTRRTTGRWLRFMQERPKGIYITGTCNSFKGIPPEYLRPGRWDTSPFFIDLPNDDEKEQIFSYYCSKLGLEDDSSKVNSEMWTGAEIEACCNLAKMMDISLESASGFVLPQAKTMEEEISALRSWAKGRTIPATSLTKSNGRSVRVLDIDN